ncbi:MAG: ATP-binding protein [Actinobacteria bacterium]|nr:ATP-binding protein [Actinomycetota bacterium]
MDALNPFVFSQPVDPDDLIDRDEESKRLLALAEGGHAVRLSAPRRYGKTSLLRRLGRDAEAIGMNYVEVDFYGVLSEIEVAERMEDGYAVIRSRAGELARSAIRALRPGISVGGGPVRVDSRPRVEERTKRLLSGLLDLPVGLFERTGKRTLVAFDEFQALLAVGPGIDGLFRSRIQRHGDAASYIFAGSHPGLMNELFGRYERPFFGQARAFELAPLADFDIAEYVSGRFEKTRRSVGAALDPLLDLAAGHPQRAMLLAHQLWEQTPIDQAADAECWQRAVTTVFAEHDEALRAAWDSLETKEQAVFAALAVGGAGLFAERTLTRFNLSKSSARYAREALVRGGQVRKVEGGWQPVDPLLARWAVELQHNGGEDHLR